MSKILSTAYSLRLNNATSGITGLSGQSEVGRTVALLV